MKKLLLYFLLISFGLNGQNDKAQNDTYVKDFSNYLIYNGAGSFMQLQRFCTGSVDIYRLGDANTCMSESTNFENYFFWIQDDKQYVKKIDNCGHFETREIASKQIADFITENIQTIKNENIKPYETTAIKQKIESRTEVFPCSNIFTFTNSEESVSNNLRQYDLTSNTEYPNINKEYNNNLKLVELYKLVDQEITNLESSNQLRRTNKQEVAATTTLEEPVFTPNNNKGTLRDGD